MTACTPTYLALWGVVLLSDVLSEPSYSIGRVVGLLLLTVVSAEAALRARRRSEPSGRIIFVAVALLGGACSFLQIGPMSLAAALWAMGVFGLRRDSARTGGTLVALAVFGLGASLLQAAPVLWSALDHLAGVVTTGLFGWVGGGSLGLAASGLGVAVLCLLGLLSQRFDRRSRWVFSATWVVALLVTHAGFASLSGPEGWARLAGEMLYVGALLAVVIWATRGASNARSAGGGWKSFAFIAVPFVLVGILTVVPSVAPGGGNSEPRTIQFVDQTMLGTWEAPAGIAPGSAFTGANFGLLPKYFEALGHRVVRTQGMSEGVVDGADLVVVINPGEAFAPEDVSVLHDFVRAGGGLLVLGDHTNMGGIMDHVSDLTSPLGLSLAFDSAVSAASGWPNTLRAFSPFSDGLRSVEIPVSVGASVSTILHPAVAPLLVGRRAFSDPGDESNVDSALLGSLTYDCGEAYGDVVLAAVRYFGRGKVVLFGDTSPFQNSALALGYDFTDRLVRWMTNRTGAWRAITATAAALLLLATGVVLLRRSGEVGAVLVIIAMSAAAVAGGWWVRSPEAEISVATPTAQIDLTHGNAVRLEPLHTRGVEALGISASRAGLIPLIRLEYLVTSAVDPIGVILCVTPTEAFPENEGQELLSWVDRGGRLVLATCWPQSRILETFLDSLGLTIQASPLGTIRPTVDGLDVQPELPAAWPLSTSDEWKPVGTVRLDETDYIVVAERRFGRGSIIVVGDGEILTNESLEGKGYAFVENLALVSRLLAPPNEEGDL